MAPPTPSFIASLQAFDPQLSVRWGPTIDQWVIQRKGIIGEPELKFLARTRERLRMTISRGLASQEQQSRYKGVVEEHECAMQGQRVILFVSEFTPEIFNILALGDIRRYDGYSRYCDVQERQAEAEEEKRARAYETRRAEIHQECFGRFGMHDFIVRKRQDALRQGKRDLKSLLGIQGKAPWETDKPAALYDAYGKPIR